ncbi:MULTISPECIES: VOC family protein [Streptomyces]|uniref:VOC family protein n=1 Tax=Streptomyces morookaense TaxID=1970 RepID=A0A7Y7E6F9_STRMO|nr:MULTISPECIES: VOC family protein [Streptomyces]MCC2278791.1 VOC family protein [Streptomyces sp. ET3-23]NVK77192.1 VOC family protein [Streptomyces morookaense]GHF17449.1 chaP protein [Streptomyces morookaense]
MANELNHIIVHVKDRHRTAEFLTELTGTGKPVDWGRFTQVTSSNGVGVDFADDLVPADAINGSHLAYLVTDEEFDAILGRITERGLRYWADPAHSVEGEINTDYGGRGLYTEDPGGTLNLEFMTTPYGDEPAARPAPPSRR